MEILGNQLQNIDGLNFTAFFQLCSPYVFVYKLQEFFLSAAQKVAGSWQKAQLSNDAFAEKHENIFCIHRKMQMLVLFDSEN